MTSPTRCALTRRGFLILYALVARYVIEDVASGGVKG